MRADDEDHVLCAPRMGQEPPPKEEEDYDPRSLFEVSVALAVAALLPARHSHFHR